MLTYGRYAYGKKLYKCTIWFKQIFSSSSFVGLLFYVTLKFALAVPWGIVRVLLGAAAFIALLKRVDVFYVVLTGAAISIAVF